MTVPSYTEDPYPDHDVALIDLIQGEMAAWWEDDETRNAACRIADQLHRAGRLVPPGSEVREELGASHDGCEHWNIASDESGLLRWLADHPSWRPLRRKVINYRSTPWSPSVPDTEEGSKDA